MKKFLGILFLLIVIAIGVGAYFFPGLPYYYKCTHDLEFRESLTHELPIASPDVPENSADYANPGIRLTAWGDMEAQRTNDKNQALWENKDGSHTVSIYAETLGDNYDFLDRTNISHESLDRYCKAVKKTTPETNYEFVKLVCSLTMDDFDIHDLKNAKTFSKMMSIKNENFVRGNTPLAHYIVDGVGYHGFMLISEDAESGKEAVINVYPEKNKHKRYIIILSFTDKDEILSIAGKIKLTE